MVSQSPRLSSDLAPARLLEVIAVQNEIAAGDLDLDQAMGLVTSRCQAITGADGAVVELAEGEEMVYRSVSGSASGSLGLRLNIHSSLSGLSVRTGAVQRCDDAATDERVDRVACLRVGVRSMICVPLLHQHRPVGVLKVLSPQPATFGDQDVKTLELFASVIAAAMNNATAFETQVSASRHKSVFLSSMSHELRTPLSAIIGFTSLLLGESDGSLSASQRESLEHVQNAAADLRALINEVLDLSRIEAGRTQLELEAVELKSVAAEVVGSLRPLAEERRLELRCELADGVSVRADQQRLRQVLSNLVANAVKFTEAGEVVVTSETRDSLVAIRIRDTGVGMPASDLERIFEPFERAGDRSAEGTGLGLAITEKLVKLMGGRIEVTSETGVGSTFTVHLPAA